MEGAARKIKLKRSARRSNSFEIKTLIAGVDALPRAAPTSLSSKTVPAEARLSLAGLVSIIYSMDRKPAREGRNPRLL